MDRLTPSTVTASVYAPDPLKRRHPADRRIRFVSEPLLEYEPEGRTQAEVERMHEPTDRWLRTEAGTDESRAALIELAAMIRA